MSGAADGLGRHSAFAPSICRLPDRRPDRNTVTPQGIQDGVVVEAQLLPDPDAGQAFFVHSHRLFHL
jgi:hypothetical protein